MSSEDVISESNERDSQPYMNQPYYSLLELLFLMPLQISVSDIACVCSASLLILLVIPFAVCIIYIPMLQRCLLSPVLHSPGGGWLHSLISAGCLYSCTRSGAEPHPPANKPSWIYRCTVTPDTKYLLRKQKKVNCDSIVSIKTDNRIQNCRQQHCWWWQC